MIVRFWGTRGSLAAPLSAAGVREKVREALVCARGRDLTEDAALDTFIEETLRFTVSGTFGGNTSCVELDAGDSYVLCDLGTGVREFGNRFMAHPDPRKKKEFNVFVSHVHWDHIMGFPFFVPAYIPGHTVRIHGCHDVLEEAFRHQNGAPGFPVPFDVLGADIEFVVLEAGKTYEVSGYTVRTIKQHHGGDSYGYRFERDGKAVVYSTDAEYKIEAPEIMDAFVRFAEDADLVIFDAMYSLADSVSVKEDWGHSSNVIGVELCQRARVKHYCMYHHEPIYDDTTLQRILDETIRYEQISQEGAIEHAMAVSSAYDGMEIEI